MRMIFYCPNCEFTGSDEEGNKPSCTECGTPLVLTELTQDYWRSLNAKQKIVQRGMLHGKYANKAENDKDLHEGLETEMDVEYIFFCTKCNNLEMHNTVGGHYSCSQCNEPMLPLRVSVDEWNGLSNDDMLSVIENAKKSIIKRPFGRSSYEAPSVVDVIPVERVTDVEVITETSNPRNTNVSTVEYECVPTTTNVSLPPNNHISFKAPAKCPRCGATYEWRYIDTQKKGFSVGKAALGAVLLGPVGLVGGALGKKREAYSCMKCGFYREY